MICLSKNLADIYVNMFAQGSKSIIKDYDYDFKDEEILIRGLGKKILIRKCLEKQHNFYYMDSGYIGNWPNTNNPTGAKLWHRIVKNGLQHSDVINRPEDRWKTLDYKIFDRKKGKFILLVTPSEKPCKFYNINREDWILSTCETIKQYTDRPIKIRNKIIDRPERIKNSIFEDLENCHALVTYQSIAAIEAVLFGVPTFTLQSTAADPVCDKDLAKIESPTVQDQDKIYKWACHLAYGQFHNSELKNGIAYKILKDTNE